MTNGKWEPGLGTSWKPNIYLWK